MKRMTREQEQGIVEAAKQSLKLIPSKDLVVELMNRGVLRAMGATEYVPGIVRQRMAMEPAAFERIVEAKLVDAMTKQLITQHAIDMTHDKATATDPDAPPNDVVYRAEVLTIDPVFDFENEDTYGDNFARAEVRGAPATPEGSDDDPTCA